MKIVSLEENDKLSINDGQVIEILKKAQALPLSVLVMIGQGRMGKPFLFNMYIRYQYQKSFLSIYKNLCCSIINCWFENKNNCLHKSFKVGIFVVSSI